ncbi:MAG: arginine deiminase-related protein [Isosphaeraceae bacterium]|nr:arginine deiminase-related protein [Isosphaeraceae bacterium]
MPQPRVLMCAPDFYGIEYEINPWMDRRVGSDSALAHQQWNALRETLEGLGAKVERLDAVPGLPDLVFTANAGLVFGNRFFVSRFKHGPRQGESVHFARWAREHEFDVELLPENLEFEGAGDALFCGETLFAGYRTRSSVRSHQWVAEQVGVQVLPLELVDERFYHLDTCFCPLDPSTAIYHPAAFDDYGRSVLADRIPRLIEVSAEEAVIFTCNAVVVGKAVILNAGTPRLSRALSDNGFQVIPLHFSEFIKAGGSAKCLTLRLDGEEAAAWRLRPDPGASNS